MERAINYFDDHDEFYWNITGNEWEVPINNASAYITLPQGVSNQKLRFECFVGRYGVEDKSCGFEAREENSVYFSSERNLSSGEGLTVVFGWPKGIIDKPSFFQQLAWWFEKFWPIFIPIF